VREKAWLGRGDAELICDRPRLPPLWAVDKNLFTQGVPPSWDCKNTGAPGNASEPANNAPGTGHMEC